MPLANIPINRSIVDAIVAKYTITDLGQATIREISSIVNDIEKNTGVRFVRMEMGIPGLPPCEVGVKAQIEALANGVASKYPKLEGEPLFKVQASRFVEAFLDVKVPQTSCVPTTGSMQGSFAAFLTISKIDPQKDTILFIDPGFSVQKIQLQTLDIKYESFDVSPYRGHKLRKKLTKYLSKGNISAIVYSNPNNPSWISFKESELQIIGDLATHYGAIVIEDLAYFGMDFRSDYSIPYKAPFQPTIAKYCANYILLISGSKAFSYAGERVALMVVSDALMEFKPNGFYKKFGVASFGRVLIGRVLYSLSAGVSHSAQMALASIFKEAVEGRFNFIEPLREYALRAKVLKRLFLNSGFYIVYDEDVDRPIADGFYFTVNVKELHEDELIRRLFCHGISAIPLHSTGSDFEGIRVCVAQVNQAIFPDLEARLAFFKKSLDVTSY